MSPHKMTNRMKKIITITITGLFLSNQLSWAYPVYMDTLRPAASAKTAVAESFSKASSAGERAKRMKKLEIPPGAAEAFIKAMDESAELQEGFDINAEERKREFYARSKRKKVFDSLLNPDGHSGPLFEKIRVKILKKRRIFRVWVPGCSTGEELRTLIWLFRKALTSLNEDIRNWDIKCYGTDSVKNLIDEAKSRAGKPDVIYSDSDEEKHEAVIVDTEGFNAEYLVFDHNDINALGNWKAWQRKEGYFDIILLHEFPDKDDIKIGIESAVRLKGIYIVSDRIYRKVSGRKFVSIVDEKKKQKTGERPTPLLFTAEPIQLYLWLRFNMERRKRTLVIFDKMRNLKVSANDIKGRKIDSDNWLFWALAEDLIDKVYYFLPEDKKYRQAAMGTEADGYKLQMSREVFQGLPEDVDPGQLLFLVNIPHFAEAGKSLRKNFLDEMAGLFDERRSNIEMVNLCQFQTQDIRPEPRAEKNDRQAVSAFLNNSAIGPFYTVSDLDSADTWSDFAKGIIFISGSKADSKLFARKKRKENPLIFKQFINETESRKKSILLKSLRKRGKEAAWDNAKPFNTKSSSAGNSRQERILAVEGILDGLPEEVDDLGSLFHYLLTAEEEVLGDFKTDLEKYDELLEICCGWNEDDFEDKRAWYIIKQAKQVIDPDMAIEIAPGRFEVKIMKGKRLETSEGISIAPTRIGYREGGIIPYQIRFKVVAPADYPIIRPDSEFRNEDLSQWRYIVTHNTGLRFVTTHPMRKFFRPNFRDTIWIGGEKGYRFRIERFPHEEERGVLLSKGFLCAAVVTEPDEDFVAPGVLLRRDGKFSSAGQEQLEELEAIAGRWKEIFADILKDARHKAGIATEGMSDYERGYGLREIIDYSTFSNPNRIFESDQEFLRKFLWESVEQYQPPPADKRKTKSLTVISIRNGALASIKRGLNPVHHKPSAASRHINQRNYDEKVFLDKIEHFKMLASLNLDSDEKLQLVLKEMIGFLKDNGESLFSKSHISGNIIHKDDWVYQPVLMACSLMVLDAVADLNPEKTTLALIPLLKPKQIDQYTRPKVEDILIKCLKTEKDAGIKRGLALKMRKSAEKLPEEERYSFAARISELMPKIKVNVHHIVALAEGESFETEGLCDVEAGSKLKEAMPLLGIPMINDQAVEVERDGASLKADYIKGEVLQEDDRVTVMSEMGGDFESLLKLAAKNGIIRPDTFTEAQKRGLIFIMLALKQAGYEILRHMKDLSYEQRDTYGELEKIGTVNVFSEKVYEIISELGSTKAKLFLKEFVLPVIKENKVPLLYNIFPEWSYSKLFGPVTAVLRYAGGYEGIDKLLELCYWELTGGDDDKERFIVVKKMVAIFSRIGQQMEHLEPDEFKAWLNEFLSVAKFEEVSYFSGPPVYIVQESNQSFVYYSSTSSTDYKPLPGITIFSETLGFKTLDEARQFLELMQDCRIDIRRIDKNVLELLDFFSGPIGRKIVKGFTGFKEGYGVGDGVVYLDRDRIIGDRFHSGLGSSHDGIEKRGDTLIVHFDEFYNFEVDITGLSIPGPNTKDGPYELRLRFCILHELPFTEQKKIDVSERDWPTLIYDKRQAQPVIWQADTMKRTFVKQESKASSAGAALTEELHKTERTASALATQA